MHAHSKDNEAQPRNDLWLPGGSGVNNQLHRVNSGALGSPPVHHRGSGRKSSAQKVENVLRLFVADSAVGKCPLDRRACHGPV